MIDEESNRRADEFEGNKTTNRQAMVNRLMTKKVHEMFVEEIYLLGRQAGMVEVFEHSATLSTEIQAPNSSVTASLTCVEDQIQQFDDLYRLTFYKSYVSHQKDIIPQQVQQLNEEEEEKIQILDETKEICDTQPVPMQTEECQVYINLGDEDSNKNAEVDLLQKCVSSKTLDSINDRCPSVQILSHEKESPEQLIIYNETNED